MTLKKSKEKNVVINEDKTGYIVQGPDGKTRSYKTLKGAEKYSNSIKISLDIPNIVTANTYFWSPSGSASGRRSNEKRRQEEIDLFCDQLNKLPAINACGSYSESCKHVYKAMLYTVNGKTTNLTGLIGACARWGLILRK